MGREYDKVLDEREFELITLVMERATKVIENHGADAPTMPDYVDSEDVDKRVLMSAMQKMQPLHQARVCGYVPR